jgi:uncharacterized protein YkwD
VSLSPVDIAVFVVIVVVAYFGYRAGFVATTYSLASWILAFAAGIAFQGPATGAVRAFAAVPQPIAVTLAFVLVILVAESIFAAAAYFALPRVLGAVRAGPLGRVDRILGIVPATVRGMFLVAVAVLAIETLPLNSEIKAAVESSATGRAVSAGLASYEPALASFAGQLGGTSLLVTKIGEDQTEALALPDDLAVAPDPVAERQLFDLVNEERTPRGLAALVWDDRLVPVARAHSEEMFALKYFSHESPVNGSPFDRLKAAGITYTRAGENLAYAQSIAVAHRALMESPGHRENILRPEFTRIGIGVISAGVYGRMVTQLFITL